MKRMPVALMSSDALTQRWVELRAARAELDAQLERISAVLVTRQPQGLAHGTERGYRGHSRAGDAPCEACLAAHAARMTAMRAARRARLEQIPTQRGEQS